MKHKKNEGRYVCRKVLYGRIYVCEDSKRYEVFERFTYSSRVLLVLGFCGIMKYIYSKLTVLYEAYYFAVSFTMRHNVR